MKLKIFLFPIFLLPIFLFAQNDNENLNEIKIIESQIKFADSISNYIEEKIQNYVVIPSHAKIGSKKKESIEIQTKTLKFSNQILRIYYAQSNLKEKWAYYYFDSKLIYAESNLFRGKKKIIRKKFYFKDENLISPLYSDREYDAEEEANVYIKAKELFKSNR